MDFTLDDIKFITNFLRYNNNYGYVDKCPHSQELYAKILRSKIFDQQFAVKGSVSQLKKKKSQQCTHRAKRANMIKCKNLLSLGKVHRCPL